MFTIFNTPKYQAAQFTPFIEYMHILQNSSYIEQEYQHSSGFDEVNLRFPKGEKIIILGSQEKGYEWITIYKIDANGNKYEQIEFMLYKESRRQNYKRAIIYSSNFEDSSFSYLSYSRYFYQGNELIKGVEEKRKINVDELSKIFYSKSMNLTELIFLADEKIFEFYEVKTLKGRKVTELKLKY